MEVEIVEDLCELCQRKDAKVHDLARATIVACHRRAVQHQLRYAGVQATSCVDLRGGSVDEAFSALGISSATLQAADFERVKSECLVQLRTFNPKQGTDAWNPVIDKDRCTECGKCHDFCPFGVYEKIEGKVTVVHPTHCKNNCPACARMCPVGAIIFPKYDKSPINGGEAIEETTAMTDKAFGIALREKLEARRREMTMLRNAGSRKGGDA